MKKKFLSILVAICLIFPVFSTLGACGGKKNKNPSEYNVSVKLLTSEESAGHVHLMEENSNESEITLKVNPGDSQVITLIFDAAYEHEPMTAKLNGEGILGTFQAYDRNGSVSNLTTKRKWVYTIGNIHEDKAVEIDATNCGIASITYVVPASFLSGAKYAIAKDDVQYAMELNSSSIERVSSVPSSGKISIPYGKNFYLLTTTKMDGVALKTAGGQTEKTYPVSNSLGEDYVFVDGEQSYFVYFVENSVPNKMTYNLSAPDNKYYTSYYPDSYNVLTASGYGISALHEVSEGGFEFASSEEADAARLEAFALDKEKGYTDHAVYLGNSLNYIRQRDSERADYYENTFYFKIETTIPAEQLDCYLLSLDNTRNRVYLDLLQNVKGDGEGYFVRLTRNNVMPLVNRNMEVEGSQGFGGGCGIIVVDIKDEYKSLYTKLNFSCDEFSDSIFRGEGLDFRFFEKENRANIIRVFDIKEQRTNTYVLKEDLNAESGAELEIMLSASPYVLKTGAQKNMASAKVRIFDASGNDLTGGEINAPINGDNVEVSILKDGQYGVDKENLGSAYEIQVTFAYSDFENRYENADLKVELNDLPADCKIYYSESISAPFSEWKLLSANETLKLSTNKPIYFVAVGELKMENFVMSFDDDGGRINISSLSALKDLRGESCLTDTGAQIFFLCAHPNNYKATNSLYLTYKA